MEKECWEERVREIKTKIERVVEGKLVLQPLLTRQIKVSFIVAMNFRIPSWDGVGRLKLPDFHKRPTIQKVDHDVTDRCPVCPRI